MHFDQLDPYLPEYSEELINPSEPWQYSDEFAHDHGIAYSLAVQLGSEVYCEGFCTALDVAETQFLELTTECQRVSEDGTRVIEIVAVKEVIEFFRSD